MRRSATIAKLLLTAYVVVLLFVLFSPSSAAPSAVVSGLSDTLLGAGLPADLVGYARLEVAMNAVMVVPLTLLGSLVRPSLTWRDWTAYGLVAALVVEGLQALVLPDRQAAFSDVVANAVGAMAGSWVPWLLGRRLSGG